MDGVDRVHSVRLPIASLILGGLSCIGMLASIWLIFFYTPIDALQGVTQRIFYFHVPTAWVGMLGFVVMTVTGIIYLIRPDERLDWIARASGEVGAVFLTFLLITGSLWGKPIWGAWWVWDPKLTAALILWFMFIGYLMLRSYMGHTSESARLGAVWSIVGVIDVPIIYFSVLLLEVSHVQVDHSRAWAGNRFRRRAVVWRSSSHRSRQSVGSRRTAGAAANPGDQGQDQSTGGQAASRHRRCRTSAPTSSEPTTTPALRRLTLTSRNSTRRPRISSTC